MKKIAKEIVAKQLDKLMDAVPALGTQQALAKKSGVGQTTIGRIRRGEVNPTSENMKAIADAFGVPVGYFYEEEGSPERLALNQMRANYSVSNAIPASTKGLLPLISYVQAGEWTDIVDQFQPGEAEEWLPCPFKHGDDSFILQVDGYSMHNPGGEKSYAPGEFIAVDPRKEPKNRSMVVAKIDGEERATFKQLLIEADGTYLLQALNPSWPQRIMPMPSGSRIVGVVIGKWTPE